MEVALLAHTQLAHNFIEELLNSEVSDIFFEDENVWNNDIADGQVVSLAAIRECYSYKTAIEVVKTESKKYLGDGGKEGKRLFDHIVKSKHVSTMEHIHFTFAVEGVSRALLAQLTRHRQLSFSVQSQRYNKFSFDSRSGGFSYVVPATCESSQENTIHCEGAFGIFEDAMSAAQRYYDELILSGIPQEDARAVLPNAATCNLVTSGNLRAWLEFYNKRKRGNGAQAEIAEFAERIKDAIVAVEPWTAPYFENA